MTRLLDQLPDVASVGQPTAQDDVDMQSTMSTLDPMASPQHCLRCGRGPKQGAAFRSRNALTCNDCQVEIRSERKDYERNYMRAKRRATQRLAEKYADEFAIMLAEERLIVEEEEERAKSSRRRSRVS